MTENDIQRKKIICFQTPLHLAIRDNSLDIVELLLAFGADPVIKVRTSSRFPTLKLFPGKSFFLLKISNA
jgi:ankyrin repeat protein